MRRTALVVALLTSACAANPPPPATPAAAPPPQAAPEAVAEPAPAITYPATRRMDLSETQFGVAVADPYRWLENDVRQDAEVRAWVEAQNRISEAFLARLPEVASFKTLL